MSARRDKHYSNLPVDLVASVKKSAAILGLNESEAAEMALREWDQRHHDEVQEILDTYMQRGIIINQPEAVQINVTVFQKADLLVAKDKMQRLLDILPDIQDPASRRETQLELAKALKVIQPVFVKTRDPKLAELLKQADEALEQ